MPDQELTTQLMLRLFEEQKEHIDGRFTEVKTKISDIKTDVCDLKKNKKKQLIVAALTGLLGGASIMILHCMTGGKIFDVLHYTLP